MILDLDIMYSHKSLTYSIDGATLGVLETVGSGTQLEELGFWGQVIWDCILPQAPL
jgi:hypothetical protein